MKKFFISVFLLALSAAAAPAGAETGLPVFVSILPQKYFVQKIGGDNVDVSVMVRPGSSPATYEPSPRRMAALSGARAYFAVGVPFEKNWLPRIASANPDMPVIHTDQGVDKMPVGAHEHHDHDGEAHAERHGDAGRGRRHRQGILDPHIWLAPEPVRIQAKNIHDGLARIDPENAQAYAENLAAFIREIDRLNHEIKDILAPLEAGRRTFMVFHPSWGYFARQYGLKQIAVEAGGKEPGPGKLAEIIKLGRELGIKTVFVQPQFSQKSAVVIARELGAEVVTLDPLSPDWDDNLIKAAGAIRDAALKNGD